MSIVETVQGSIPLKFVIKFPRNFHADKNIIYEFYNYFNKISDITFKATFNDSFSVFHFKVEYQ